MPVVAKCPNCNGPLDKAPTGPEQKCPYCGATLLATRFMPSPVAPPPGPGSFSAGNAPGYPPPAWGSPAAGHPYPPPPPAPLAPLQPLPVLATAKRSMTMYLISSVITVLVIGGAVFASIWAQREVTERTQQAVQTAAQTQQERTAPIKLAPQTLQPGQEVLIDLPGSTPERSGRIVATLNLELQEETLFQVDLSADSVIASCRIKALDPQGNALARSEEGRSAQIFPVLPQGASQISMDCDSHPSERSVRIVARPVPIVVAGTPAQVVIGKGMKSAGAVIVPDAAGLYAVAVDCSDSSVGMEVLGPDDLLVGKQDINTSTGRAVLEAKLEVEGYLVLVSYSFEASEKIPATVVLTRIDPERIALGGEATSTMTKHTERRYYQLELDAATKVEVTLTSGAFPHTVEIQRADGVPVATSDEQRPGRAAKAAPNTPLEPGEYRIVVRGEQYTASEGDYTLRVEAVPDAPPTKRGGRRGSR